MELVYEKNLVEIWRVTPSVYFRKGSMAGGVRVAYSRLPSFID